MRRDSSGGGGSLFGLVVTLLGRKKLCHLVQRKGCHRMIGATVRLPQCEQTAIQRFRIGILGSVTVNGRKRFDGRKYLWIARRCCVPLVNRPLELLRCFLDVGLVHEQGGRRQIAGEFHPRRCRDPLADCNRPFDGGKSLVRVALRARDGSQLLQGGGQCEAVRSASPSRQ